MLRHYPLCASKRWRGMWKRDVSAEWGQTSWGLCKWETEEDNVFPTIETLWDLKTFYDLLIMNAKMDFSAINNPILWIVTTKQWQIYIFFTVYTKHTVVIKVTEEIVQANKKKHTDEHIVLHDCGTWHGCQSHNHQKLHTISIHHTSSVEKPKELISQVVCV